MKYIKFLYIILCCIACLNVHAQKISGRIVEDTPDGKIGLAGANVYWIGTTIGVVADANGSFSIAWNEKGQLAASFIGYQTEIINVKRSDRNIEILLVAGEALEEVGVTARLNSTIMSTRGPLIEQLITGEELCKAACCNLGESFTTNASVDVAYSDAVTGAKQIQLLGLTGKYVQMMTENMPNFRGVSSLYGLSYVPGPWMSAISVSKGTGSVINGYEAIAGQISVDYKKPRVSEKLYLNGFTSSEGMYEFNANTGILLNDRWSAALLIHGDWYNREHTSGESHHQAGFLSMPKKTQYNIMNRWEYKSDIWNVQFGGKFLDETRLGGQKGFKEDMRDNIGGHNLYGIGIDTRRYETFLKLGYLMPEYEHSSMALLINATDHDQQSYYGARDYNARQKSLFMNYIYQSVFANNENQKFSAGVSFNYDNYDESFNDYLAISGTKTPLVFFDRQEKAAGAFFQYTGTYWKRLTLMLGIRYDYHNLFKGFVTPRAHIMYAPDDFTMLKLSTGKGSRTTNILSENSYLLATAYSFYVNNKLLAEHPEDLSNLEMEEAWNFGFQVNRKFTLFNRTLNINLDYYRTEFKNQVVVDNETQPDKVNFYNLEGDSYSNCYQAEIKYELLPRLDLLCALRYNDVKITYTDPAGDQLLLRTPLQSKYKGLLNASYSTNMKKWQFDFTTQFNGSGRVSSSSTVPEMYRSADHFDEFQIMNAQVTKYFRKWSVYAGCENIGDFTQKNPVIAADDPWSEYFDASKVWGPIHGRKFYIGLRFAIDRN